MAQTKVKLISDGVIVQGNLHASHGITTAHIGEGSNLYYTDARVGSYLSTNSFATESYVGTQIANLVDSSPSALNTLNELAAALGDDANFSTTVTNSIASKAPLASPSFTGTSTFAGRVNAGESFGALKDGADTVADGPFFRLTNAATTRQYLFQLDASNNIDYWYYNGSAWTQTISLLTNGGATFAGSITTNLSSAGAYFTGGSGGVRQLSITSGTNISAHALHTFNIASSNGKYEFDVNGTTELSLDSSNATFAGDVGIGGTPGQNLDIQKPGARFRLIDGTNQLNMGLWDGSNYRFEGDANRPIYMTSYQGNIKFGISGGTTMTIQSTGVGIGTTSPSGKLHISQNSSLSNQYLNLSNTETGHVRNWSIGLANASSGAFRIFDLTANTERLRIDSSGLVSIKNVSNPTIQLTNTDTSLTSNQVIGSFDWYQSDPSGGGVGIINRISAINDSGFQGEASFSFQTGNTTDGLTEKMRITSGGNVGINETSPGSYYGDQLVIACPDENGITIMGTASNQKQYLCWASNSTGANAYAGFIAYDHNTNAMSLATNGGAGAITIDNAQNVGIGTTSPSTALHIDQPSNDRAGGIYTRLNGNNYGLCMFVNSGGYGIIGSNGNYTTDVLTMDLNTGHVGIGDASPSFPLVISKSSSTASNGSDVSMRLNLVNTDQTNNNWALINFSDGTSQPGSGFMGMQFTDHTNNYGDLSFGTRGASGYGERMRIGSTGRITMFGLDGKTQTGSDVRFNTTSKEIYYFTSSRRYKTDIVNLENSLDKINALRPVRFKDIKTREDACGLIAEETFEIIPDVVFTKEIEGFDKPQIEGINYSDLVPFLIKSIQELKARIETLENN